MNFQLRSLLLLVLSFVISLDLIAADIVKVSKKKLLLKVNEAEIFDKGDRLYVYDNNNKKRAIIVIDQVKGNKALATIKKGTAKKSWTALSEVKKGKPKAAATKAQAKKEKDQPKATADAPLKKWTFGVVGGLSSTTMEVDMTSEVVSNTGTNLGLKGFGRYHLNQRLSVMGTLGYEGFNTTGKAEGSVCGDDSTSNCTTSISFLTGELWGQFYLSRGKIAYWLGGGASFSFPLTKTSNAVDDEGIGVSNFMLFGVGFDYYLANNKAIPFWFEIAKMPDAATVKANYLGIKVGYQF